MNQEKNKVIEDADDDGVEGTVCSASVNYFQDGAFEGDFFECKKRAAHTGDHLAVVEGTKGEKIRVYWK